MIIGITGSIATGKSTVSQYIKEQNFTVIDADKIAKQLLHIGSPFLSRVVSLFGTNILNDTGELNRQKLSNIIFSDENAREQLNQILHPAILKTMQIQTQLAIQNGEKHIFWDVPLLFETQFHQYVDQIIVVYTAPQEQLNRLMQRNCINENQAQIMINSQQSIVDKVKRADINIDNTGSLQQTYQQLEQYLKSIK